MRKLPLILLGLVVLILLVSFIFNKVDSANAAPGVKEAKYVVKTGQTYYYTDYADEFTHRVFGKIVVLHGYWDSKDGKKWTYHGADLQLSYLAYPELEIGERH